MPIIRRIKNDPDKFETARFNSKKYERWLANNSNTEDFLLYKLNSNWAEKFDNSNELIEDGVDKENKTIIYIFSLRSSMINDGFFRYRIPEECLDWVAI